MCSQAQAPALETQLHPGWNKLRRRRKARLQEHRPTMPAVKRSYPAAKTSALALATFHQPWQRCRCRRCLAT